LYDINIHFQLCGIKHNLFSSVFKPFSVRKQYNFRIFTYDGPDKPAGVWRLENVPGGLTIENRFKEEQIDNCRFSISEKMNMARMEIQTPERVVPPEGKITIEHTWGIKKY